MHTVRELDGCSLGRRLPSFCFFALAHGVSPPEAHSPMPSCVACSRLAAGDRRSGPRPARAGSIGDLVDRLIGDEVDPTTTASSVSSHWHGSRRRNCSRRCCGDADPSRTATSGWRPVLQRAACVGRHPAHARRRGGAGTDPAPTDPVGEAALRRSIADHLHRRAGGGGTPRALDGARAAAPRRRPQRAVGIRLRRRQPLSDRPHPDGDADRGSERSSMRSGCQRVVGSHQGVLPPTIPSAAASHATRAAEWAATSSPSRLRVRPPRPSTIRLLGPWLRYAHDEARHDERRPVAGGGRPDGRGWAR